MKTKVITVATSDGDGLRKLKESCKQNNIDLEVLGFGNSWLGFGSKIIWLRDYLQNLRTFGYTHFIFIDAYDVVFLKGLNHIESVYNEFYKDQIVFSAEKGCYPDWDLQDKYPKVDSAWRYLNSGSYMAPVDKYMEMVDKYPVKFSDDDQRYFTNIFLNDDIIKLDYDCEIFQSIAFEAEFTDFAIDHGKFYNKECYTEPAIIHGNGKTDLTKVYTLLEWNDMNQLVEKWEDKEEFHKKVHDDFVQKVNMSYDLNEHRTFVEHNSFGFGERSFPWMWKLIVDKMPPMFAFLEIGVFRGQVLSLIELLASKEHKFVDRYGVTPLNTADGHWESDYRKDIETIHDEFNLSKDYTIIEGYSTDPEVIKKASERTYDIVYIDGGHTSEVVESDLKHYLPLVKQGGYLVIDDCANKYHMPWGYFQGIDPVSHEVDKVLPNAEFTELFNVVHNRVWRRN